MNNCCLLFLFFVCCHRFILKLFSQYVRSSACCEFHVISTLWLPRLICLVAGGTLDLLHFWGLPSDLPHSDCRPLSWFVYSFPGAYPLVGSCCIGRRKVHFWDLAWWIEDFLILPYHFLDGLARGTILGWRSFSLRILKILLYSNITPDITLFQKQYWKLWLSILLLRNPMPF